MLRVASSLPLSASPRRHRSREVRRRETPYLPRCPLSRPGGWRGAGSLGGYRCRRCRVQPPRRVGSVLSRQVGRQVGRQVWQAGRCGTQVYYWSREGRADTRHYTQGRTVSPIFHLPVHPTHLSVHPRGATVSRSIQIYLGSISAPAAVPSCFGRGRVEALSPRVTRACRPHVAWQRWGRG